MSELATMVFTGGVEKNIQINYALIMLDCLEILGEVHVRQRRLLLWSVDYSLRLHEPPGVHTQSWSIKVGIGNGYCEGNRELCLELKPCGLITY
jgi:hypothetical protein